MITYPTNKLQKVVLGGGCEQRNLPSGYTQVEYIEMTGIQHINTNIIPTINFKAEVKFAPTQVNAVGYWGARQDPYRFCCTTFLNGTQFCVGMTNDTWPANRTEIVLNNIYDCVIANGYARINGTEYTETPVTAFNITSTFKLGYVSYDNPSNARYYKCKLWDNDVLVFNGIPARRNSDNVLGMYDIVTNTFLTNAGTGTFTAGADVTVPSPDYPMDVVCNNGVVKVSKNLLNLNAPGVERGKYMNDSGNVNRDGASTISDFIPCTEGVYYTAQTMPAIIGSNLRVHGYDENKNWVQMLIKTPSPVGIITTATCQIPAGIKYIKISCYMENTYGKNTMLELGSTATPYMPYGIYIDGTQEVVTDSLGNTANAERLLAVGDYQDVQSVLDGRVTRNVGIKVLDGTEDWTYDSTYSRFLTYISGMSTGAVRTLPLLCNYYQCIDDGRPVANVPNYSIYAGSRTELYVKTTQYTSPSDWKTYLSTQYANGTPVIVIYPLAEPTTETVTPQPLTGNTATVTAGSIDNLPIESSTIAELKKRYIGDKEVKRVYIGENLVWEDN